MSGMSSSVENTIPSGPTRRVGRPTSSGGSADDARTITNSACSMTAFSALRRLSRFIDASVSPMMATMKNSNAPSTHMWTTHQRQNSVITMFVSGV